MRGENVTFASQFTTCPVHPHMRGGKRTWTGTATARLDGNPHKRGKTLLGLPPVLDAVHPHCVEN